MKRVKMLMALLSLMIVSCSDEDVELEKKYVVVDVEQRSADDEVMLTREELLNRLRGSGLIVETRPVKRTPRSLERTFPAKPREHFMMSIDQELFWVSRFETIGQAKKVSRDFSDGFRFSNWHFGGQITVATSNRIVNALDLKTKLK